MSALIVPLTQDYRLAADDRNYVVQRRRTVDPTKAPGYVQRADSPAPATRTVWEDAGYYPLNNDGLAAAIQAVAHKSISARSEAVSFAEYVAELKGEYAALKEAIGGAV